MTTIDDLRVLRTAKMSDGYPSIFMEQASVDDLVSVLKQLGAEEVLASPTETIAGIRGSLDTVEEPGIYLVFRLKDGFWYQ